MRKGATAGGTSARFACGYIGPRQELGARSSTRLREPQENRPSGVRRVPRGDRRFRYPSRQEHVVEHLRSPRSRANLDLPIAARVRSLDPLGLYKQVRDDVTAAAPVRNGRVGAGVEVHEKASLESGRGVVVIVTTMPADSVYFTERVVSERYTATDGLSVTQTADGRTGTQIEPRFPGVGIVFLG